MYEGGHWQHASGLLQFGGLVYHWLLSEARAWMLTRIR